MVRIRRAFHVIHWLAVDRKASETDCFDCQGGGMEWDIGLSSRFRIRSWSSSLVCQLRFMVVEVLDQGNIFN